MAEMREHRERRQAFRVGLLTLAALVVFGIAVVSIGTTQGAFSKKIHFHAFFQNIAGLSEGAPVKLAGVPIGHVTAITFPEELSRSDIRIDFKVDRNKAIRIRGGTMAALRALSLLSGEKYIELSPGDPNQQQYSAGGRIPAEKQKGGLAEIGGAATDVAAEVVKIANNLNGILVSINEGHGLLGKAVADPDFGKPTLDAIQNSLEQIQDVLSRIRQGKSLAGVLLTDERYGHKVAGRLDASLASLQSILAKVDKGDGTASQLLNDPESGKAIVKNLAAATEELREILDAMKRGEGLLAKIVYDKEYGDKVSSDLAETVSNLKSITAKIDRGDGTLGKVLNDPGLYASAKDIVSGIDKSKIVGPILRHYQKKGLRSRSKEAAERLGSDGARKKLEQTYGEDLTQENR